jgi:CheY-like chemotaxis protein
MSDLLRLLQTFIQLKITIYKTHFIGGFHHMWLVVEDDGDIRMFLSTLMMLWGESTQAFPDGQTAWDWLDSVEKGVYKGELPDLVLTDIRMPGYTGDQISARIRTIPALRDTPVILMTAFTKSDGEIIQLRQQCGADHLINKPLPDMDELRKMLYNTRDRVRAERIKVAEVVAVEDKNAEAPIPQITSKTPDVETPSITSDHPSSILPNDEQKDKKDQSA